MTSLKEAIDRARRHEATGLAGGQLTSAPFTNKRPNAQNMTIVAADRYADDFADGSIDRARYHEATGLAGVNFKALQKQVTHRAIVNCTGGALVGTGH